MLRLSLTSVTRDRLTSVLGFLLLWGKDESCQDNSQGFFLGSTPRPQPLEMLLTQVSTAELIRSEGHGHIGPVQ